MLARAIFLTIALLLFLGCRERPAGEQSRFLLPRTPGMKMQLPFSALKAAYPRLDPAMITDVAANEDASRIALVFDSPSPQVLLYERSTSQSARLCVLPSMPLELDLKRLWAYVVTEDAARKRKLLSMCDLSEPGVVQPDGLAPLPLAAQDITVTDSPGDGGAWCVWTELDAKPGLTRGRFLHLSFEGVETRGDLPAAAPAGTRTALASLPTGDAVAALGGSVYRVDAKGGAVTKLAELQSPGGVLLGADPGDAGVMAVVTRQTGVAAAVAGEGAAEGVPLAPAAPLEGALLVLSTTDGKELSRVGLGGLSFIAIGMDWKAKHCMLQGEETGIACADFVTKRLIWPLRLTADYPPLMVLPARREVWGMLDDGLAGISYDGLLAAPEQQRGGAGLSGEQMDAVRAVATSLGWRWNETRFSPIRPFQDGITVFDGSASMASQAAFDWVIKEGRTASLAMVRPATADDAKLALANASEVDAYCLGILKALGYPDAERTQSTVRESPPEATYVFGPGLTGSPGDTEGTFKLMITPSEFSLALESHGKGEL